MAQDWSADVKKYVPDADDDIISGIVRHCGIALHKVDSALVAFSDPAETGRVRDGFLKKKLALTLPDSELDAAIATVGETMKADRTKNRVTVYYLLAQAFGQLELFRKAPPATRTKAATGDSAVAVGAAAAGASSLLPQKGAARSTEPMVEVSAPIADSGMSAAGLGAAAVTGAAAIGLGALGGASVNSPPAIDPVRMADVPPPPPPPVATPADPNEPISRRERYVTTPDEPVVETTAGGSMGWLPWLLLGLGVLALLWYFLIHRPHERAEDAAPVATAPAAEPATMTTTNTVAVNTAAPSAVPAPAAVTIPTGAGVTNETRDGKPAVNVYFDTSKAVVAPAFAAAAASLKTYLDAHVGSKLAVSGYNDKTGNAALNAELSKNRAKAVRAALVAAAIPVASIELTKPSETTDTKTTDASARRVEVLVK